MLPPAQYQSFLCCIVLLFRCCSRCPDRQELVCGGRFLVHRYSVLQQHLDTQGDEQLDTGLGVPRRGSGYHDDSDEVRGAER
ncbi:hypothetical protein FKM82_023080, partial [Ascaphus truei]